MGREYKHSVKNSLTRKLVLIIISSVVILYTTVFVVQIQTASNQSIDAEELLKNQKQLSLTN